VFPINANGIGGTFSSGPACQEPWFSEDRGLYFNNGSEFSYQDVEINGLDLCEDFTIELWIRPVTVLGTVFSFKLENAMYNGNLWISSCRGLVLDWGSASRLD
jgi:hypothetical protein